MHPSAQPTVRVVLLAIIAIGSCLGYVTSDVTVTRSQFTWEETRSGEPATLVLAAQSPQQLRWTGPCPAAGAPQDLLTTGDPAGPSLTVRTDGSNVWMTYLGQPRGDLLAVQPPCQVTASYDRRSNMASLTAAGVSTKAALTPLVTDYPPAASTRFTVTALWAAPGTRATLLTQPTSFSSSGWRSLWILACFGSLLAIGRTLYVRDPLSADRAASRYAPQDILVAVAGLVALVVVPPRFDDGWVLTTVRNYSDLGFFSNYYSVDATAQPQGFWWTWLERLWLVPHGTPGFALRLPTVVILLATWWLVRRWILHPLGTSAVGLWAAALMAVSGLIALQTTLRPEPIVAMLLAAAVSVIVRYRRSPQPWLLVVLGALSAAAVAVHQTGWSVVAACTVIAPQAIVRARRERGGMVLAAIGLGSAALAALLLMLGSNVNLWWQSVRNFAEDSVTYQSTFDETQRWAALATRYDQPAIVFAALAAMLLASLGVLSIWHRLNPDQRIATGACLASFAGLLLTSSKLVDHYAAVVPAATVLAGIVVTMATRPVMVSAVCGLAGIVAVGLTRPGVWALGLERASLLGLGGWRTAAYVALLFTTAVSLTLIARRRDVAAQGVAGLGAIVLVAALVSLGPLVVDGIRTPTSWVGQQVAAVHADTCGLVDAMNLQQTSASGFASPRHNVEAGVATLTKAPGQSVWAIGGFGPMPLSVSSGGTTTQLTLSPSPALWSLVPVPVEQTATVRWADPTVALVSAPVTQVPARERADQPWWVEPGLALQAPCLSTVSIRSGTIPVPQFSLGRPGWSGLGLRFSTSLMYDAACPAVTVSGRQCLVALVRKDVSPATMREITERVS